MVGFVFAVLGLQAAGKPNVLFISVDDMNNDLGTYGRAWAKTPALDSLAKRGVRFDRAYCQYPLCSPSRTSVLTGMRPDTTRVFDLAYHFRSEMPGIVTLPQQFQKHGYRTARVGKIYHYGNPDDIGTPGLDDPASWELAINPIGIDKSQLEPKIIKYTKGPGLGAALAWYSDPDGRDEDHTDGKVASEGIRLLEKHKDEPFFIALGFYRPHCPFVAPKKYFDMHPLDEVPVLPEKPARDTNTVPAAAYSSYAQIFPYMGITAAEARQILRAYRASNSFVDAQIGRVLTALDRLGLSKNTIVVFWSDHGYMLGEHGLFMKQVCFEESARVPLIISGPGIARGKASPRTVELVDLYPTLIDLAGIKKDAPVLEGASLRPLLKNPTARWDRPAHTQIQRGKDVGHSVRTERWRYTAWNGGILGMELYDHQNDPKEERNLASDPRHKETLAHLQRLVAANHPVLVVPGKAVKKKYRVRSERPR